MRHLQILYLWKVPKENWPGLKKRTNIKLLFISLLIAFVIGELVLAVAGFNPRRGLFLEVPELNKFYSVDSIDGLLFNKKSRKEFNDAGFRDVDAFVNMDNDSSLKKILVLGDSFTYGAAAIYSGKPGFVEVMEASLNEKCNTVAWNTGIPGIGQVQQLHILKRYLPLMKPDIVVLGFYMNDFYENVFPMGIHYVYQTGEWINRYEQLAEGKMKTLTPKEAYYRAHPVVTSLSNLHESSRIFKLLGQVLSKYGSPKNKMKGKVSEEAIRGLEITDALMGQIKQEVDSTNTSFLVLIIPSRKDITAGKPGVQYEAIMEIVRNHNMPTMEVFSDLTPEDYMQTSDTHWTAEAHLKIGRYLSTRLQETLDCK